MFASRTGWSLEPNRLSAAQQAYRASGREVLDLTESNPTRCGFAYPEQLLDALRHPAALAYDPDPRGLASARAAIAAYYAERASQVHPDNIFLTTSTSEAYSYIFRLLCGPGDQVLVPAPSYPLFEFLAGIQDVELVSYPLFYDYGWHLDVHALAEAVTPRTRALMVVNPNNPTGSYVRPEELAGLHRLCREHSLALVADEVFLDFPLDGTPRSSLAGNGTVLTFALSGLSKIAGLPQMKAAWLALSGPRDLAAAASARLEVIVDTYLSMNAPIQLALPAFLAHRHSFQREVMTRIHANLAELDRRLASRKGTIRLAVEGGWYAVLRVPAIGPDEDLAIALLQQTGVLLHPGHFYGFPTDGYLVLSLITPAERFAAGIARLVSFLDEAA